MGLALSRAVAAFRLLALGYAAVLVAVNHHDYVRPGLGWGLLGAMAAWTAVTVVAYEKTPRWPWWLLATDLAVAIGLVLATLAVESSGRIAAGAPTLPAAWAAAPVLACALWGGPWLGGLAGLAVGAADIVERGGLGEHTFNGVVLLVVAGAVGGYVVRLVDRSEQIVAAAARLESAQAERDRLAREIHDSTLQVLALVARRGSELGGEASVLAGLAAEQEVALRRLVTHGVATVQPDGVEDLRQLLLALEAPGVTVGAPTEDLLVPVTISQAVMATVAEAMANVSRHAGPQAQVWVLLEWTNAEIVVTVRDDGVGIAPERLADAAGAGRLGVAQSILGRIESIGGTARVDSAPGRGTEVEISVPR
jgi:signal transduction histidine kinase